MRKFISAAAIAGVLVAGAAFAQTTTPANPQTSGTTAAAPQTGKPATKHQAKKADKAEKKSAKAAKRAAKKGGTTTPTPPAQ